MRSSEPLVLDVSGHVAGLGVLVVVEIAHAGQAQAAQLVDSQLGAVAAAAAALVVVIVIFITIVVVVVVEIGGRGGRGRRAVDDKLDVEMRRESDQAVRADHDVVYLIVAVHRVCGRRGH